MGYRAGIGLLLAKQMGVAPGVAFVFCDRCFCTKSSLTKRGDVAAWIMNRKAPPGWLMIRRERDDGTIFRQDYCPACKANPTPAAEGRGDDSR